MRLVPVALLLAVASVACSLPSDPAPLPGDSELDHEPAGSSTVAPPASENLPPPSDEREGVAPEKPTTPETNDEFSEVVYVLMRDEAFDLWFCTGTLVAKDKVVTAAHCLDPSMFVSYQVVAPLAAGKPRVGASNPKIFGGPFEQVENPDVGVLTLDTPINLPHYATLTDVVDRVEGGEQLTAAAVVRTDEEPEAPLATSQTLPLSSTVQYGYLHGFGTPYFSNGGDSGAGLFLVENGKPTHKLIAVARQPEPDRDLDHFTRVDPAFLEWFAANSN